VIVPTKGTPLTPFRLSDELLERIDRAVASANKTGRKVPYNRATWVRHALEEKLAKLDRSRRKRSEEPAPPAPAE
jgi:predicted DNA-binding protein